MKRGKKIWVCLQITLFPNERQFRLWRQRAREEHAEVVICEADTEDMDTTEGTPDPALTEKKVNKKQSSLARFFLPNPSHSDKPSSTDRKKSEQKAVISGKIFPS